MYIRIGDFIENLEGWHRIYLTAAGPAGKPEDCRHDICTDGSGPVIARNIPQPQAEACMRSLETLLAGEGSRPYLSHSGDTLVNLEGIRSVWTVEEKSIIQIRASGNDRGRYQTLDSFRADIQEEKEKARKAFEKIQKVLDAATLAPLTENDGRYDDILIYVPPCHTIIKVCEGTGDNLSREDMDLGYVDYIYYECYDCDDGMEETDGGQIVMEKYFRDEYGSTMEAVPDVLDMAYGNKDLPFILLSEDKANTWKEKNHGNDI